MRRSERILTQNQAKPRLAAGIDRYFVVWQVENTYGGLDSRFLDNEGIPISDGFGIGGDSSVDQPCVANIENSNQFFEAHAMMVHYIWNSLANLGIEGGLANPNRGGIGAFVCTFAATLYWDSRWPAAAGGGVGFLLAYESWSDSFGSPRRIWGRLIKTYQTFMPLVECE
jgi:hypothetical protein